MVRYVFAQSVEGENMLKLNGNPIIISYYFYSSMKQKLNHDFRNLITTGSRSFVLLLHEVRLQDNTCYKSNNSNFLQQTRRGVVSTMHDLSKLNTSS